MGWRRGTVVFALLGSIVMGVWGVNGAFGGEQPGPSPAALSSGTNPLKGTMTLRPETGPSCTSPDGVCYEGTIAGRLKGTVRGAASDVIATADTPSTAVVLITADVVTRTADGDLLWKEARVLRTSGPGSTTAVWTVVGGTGAFAGADGEIRITGLFHTSNGGSAEYEGTLSLP